ncbi:unnamed protein product, partial [Thlaspi arvense]
MISLLLQINIRRDGEERRFHVSRNVTAIVRRLSELCAQLLLNNYRSVEGALLHIYSPNAFDEELTINAQ